MRAVGLWFRQTPTAFGGRKRPWRNLRPAHPLRNKGTSKLEGCWFEIRGLFDVLIIDESFRLFNRIRIDVLFSIDV